MGARGGALGAPRAAAARQRHRAACFLHAALLLLLAAAAGAQGVQQETSLTIPRIMHTYFMNGEEVGALARGARSVVLGSCALKCPWPLRARTQHSRAQAQAPETGRGCGSYKRTALSAAAHPIPLLYARGAGTGCTGEARRHRLAPGVARQLQGEPPRACGKGWEAAC